MSIFKIKCQKTQKIFSCAQTLHNKTFNLLETYFSAILLLAIRIWIANIFFKSGMTKLSNMESTILLFEYEYALPFISPFLAAYMAMFAEIGCSILLVLGLLSRLSSLVFVIMTLVIQIFVFDNAEHFYWIFLLLTILTFGAGKISADYLLPKFCKKFCNSKK